jgi:hypothetical protein
MGASAFTVVSYGPSAKEAVYEHLLHSLSEDGEDDGPLAAKEGVIVFALPKGPVGETPDQIRARAGVLAQALTDEDPLIADKWGPCGAFHLWGHTWLLFGWCDD